MYKIFIFLSILLISKNTFSQTACIVVYTTENAPFILSLNDSVINNLPTKNIKLFNTEAGVQNIKIKFENTEFKEIQKDIYARQDTEIVYVIKSKTNNKMYLKMVDKQKLMFDETGYQLNAHIYEADNQLVVYIHKHQTKIINKVNNNDSLNINLNNNNYKPCSTEMLPNEFSEIILNLKMIDLESDKLQSAKQVILNNCLLSSQVRDIAGTLDFENSKLEFAKFAYQNTIDKDNYSVVNDVFEHAYTIEELSKYISNFKK